MTNRGLLIIVSAPSGCGKSTIIQALMKKHENIRFSVSATTRQPRVGEVDEVDYFFVTREKFLEMIEADEFLEHAVYVDNYYGTPSAAVQKQLDKGFDVLLDIEVKGAYQVREKCPDALSVFVVPPSYEELERRLVARGKDSAEVIKHRLETARLECLLAEQYDHTIVNDDIDRAVEELEELISAKKGV